MNAPDRWLRDATQSTCAFSAKTKTGRLFCQLNAPTQHLGMTSSALPSRIRRQATRQGVFTRNRIASGERGAAMLAALCFATVLTISLASYMTLCYRELALSSRTMQGTQAVELAEAGMEDALWALNKNDWSGWTISGTTATKAVSGFTFDAAVTGTISLRVTSYDGSAGSRTVTVTGTAVHTDGTRISRTLTSTSAPAPVFVNALAATGGVVSFASGGTVDSYDSSVGTYASQTPGYSAVIASDATAPSAATVQLMNAQVKGYAASHYSGGPSYSSSGKLVGPSTPLTTRIDTSRFSSSPYQPLFSIKVPTGAGTILAQPNNNATVSLGSSTDTTPRLYYSSGLDLVGNTKIVVNGPVRLVVSGNFDIGRNGGSPLVEVASTGTLEVFVSGEFAVLGLGIKNVSQIPKRVAIYSSRVTTESGIYTTQPFHGVVYVPNGDFYVVGDSVIYGSVVAKRISFTGTAPVVHYDVSLRSAVFAGLETAYAVSDWCETY
jgi:hypothetical protein